MPAVVRMSACHGRRFKGERPIGAATGPTPKALCQPPPPRPQTQISQRGRAKFTEGNIDLGRVWYTTHLKEKVVRSRADAALFGGHSHGIPQRRGIGCPTPCESHLGRQTDPPIHLSVLTPPPPRTLHTFSGSGPPALLFPAPGHSSARAAHPVVLVPPGQGPVAVVCGTPPLPHPMPPPPPSPSPAASAERKKALPSKQPQLPGAGPRGQGGPWPVGAAAVGVFEVDRRVPEIRGLRRVPVGLGRVHGDQQ